MLSLKESSVGDTVPNIVVFELHPKESFSNHVSTELRYGTNITLFLSFSTERALITSPRVDNDLLMLLVSIKLSSLAHVRLALSLPAKSIKQTSLNKKELKKW